MTYHLGLVKDGRRGRVIVEVARGVDQLSCELWIYYGERITTVRRLHRNIRQILTAINQEHGTSFERIAIRKIADDNYTAGHYKGSTDDRSSS